MARAPHQAQSGLIPAHAGKTCDTPREQKWCRAHPRSRGENSAWEGQHTPSSGSSPLTRGKRSSGICDQPADGLIPAHAGKTSAPCRSRPGSRAHPRSRGENSSTVPRRSPNSGSSPLTRGKPVLWVAMRAAGGLIPAHAGKTTTSLSEVSGARAHPRSRGENEQASALYNMGSGSSPLTRGKLRNRHAPCLRDGLIPAHAGKTGCVSQLASTLQAHPRSRGENAEGERIHIHGWGSSPLTRGKLRWSGPFLCAGRLIPAHAGKTRAHTVGMAAIMAHPRSRGENISEPVHPCGDAGSSPLTRGKHNKDAVRRRKCGLIPAHAGKTCAGG